MVCVTFQATVRHANKHEVWDESFTNVPNALRFGSHPHFRRQWTSVPSATLTVCTSFRITIFAVLLMTVIVFWKKIWVLEVIHYPPLFRITNYAITILIGFNLIVVPVPRSKSSRISFQDQFLISSRTLVINSENRIGFRSTDAWWREA